jgi:hypothetical protein
MVGIRVEPMVERVLENILVHAEAPAGEPRAVVSPSSVQIRLLGASTLVTAMDVSLMRVSVAPESLRGLEPNEARRVPLTVDGLPPLVVAYPPSDVVTVRRAADPAGGGGSR